MKHVFEPCTLGRLHLKNRLTRVPGTGRMSPGWDPLSAA